MRQASEDYERAERHGDDEAQSQAIREEAVALGEAIRALQAYASKAKHLRHGQFHAHLDGNVEVLKVPHDRRALNTFDPFWWVYAFTDLFYSGDFCVQKGL